MRAAKICTTAKLKDELDALDKQFAAFRKTAEGGGSPGEWMWERMGEIETELKRRGVRP
jgi:hypothetical protein